MTNTVDILFVIVLYKCKFADSKTYKSFLAGHNDITIFVYDNSSEPQVIDLPNVIYLHDPANSGLSIAYNTAAKYARRNNYKWILLLDQDSDFSDVDINDYIASINQHNNIHLFAPTVMSGNRYMSPSKMRHKFSTLQKSVPVGFIDLNKYSPINSGMCINVKAFFKCGGYNEKVSLDYSDFQFIERFKRLNSTAFIIDVVVRQNFSVFADSKEITINRYKIFCNCLKACERRSFVDNCEYFFVVFKRGTSICIKFKSLIP